MGFRSGEFSGQSSTPTPGSFNHLLVLLAVWAGDKSCWKMKSASLKGPLFPNEIQNLLSSEKRTLDHWATVQFFSLAQVRRLRRVKEFGYSCRQCVVALDALTPASVHSLWSSPKFLNQFCLTILIRLRFSRLVVHLFLPHVFLPLNFLLTCLDTALCEQPASLAMNVCGLPSLWRVSMIVFWTTVRSAVFPMIV